ncbi:GtrA-like protein [Hoylesella oralis ATCC 33269]|uniref:GtrA-like protein n=1 Tax=Hoylesella oralis ATCC 33269 TaxID=873533 RepID=E7RMJ1_9BACT|nr:GtrA family protein [Hoylesella oralis]EFZ37972.1 GtrA-like protein [Hoylesella oralis ATCC 33269]EPH16342.1 hypothetical protein HMPREF1475_01454 [Hoylesella oralis HGA0225]SHF41699.1 Putative flippase GtrA (transmembrane translocase of bactoprenol-linked glucose) [Hoylesella oralis]
MSIGRYKQLWQEHPKIRADFWRVARFGVVGTVCSAIHYGVYCLFLLFADANIAYTAGYAMGLVCNYALTTYFTFKQKPTKMNAAGFVGSHVVNYFMEIGLLNLFLWLDFSKWLAPVLVMAIAVPINFLMLHFVFLHRQKGTIS